MGDNPKKYYKKRRLKIMNENMSNELNNELETVTDFAENKAEEGTTEVLAVSDDTKSLAKDLGEMAVVGIIIYGFCKLMDFVIDKIKAGIKSLKEKRAAKKAAKAQAAAQQQAPVANVQAPTTEGTEENKQ